MTGSRIALPLGLAFACAIAALTIVPAGIDAESLLFGQDDPVVLSEHMLDHSFNADVAKREIETALAADDADLASSFVDLARERNVPVAPALKQKVDEANAAAAVAARTAGTFVRGLVTGEPDDLVGMAGTALGDLFVFGDIRDAIAEGSRFVAGEPADELILGLSCVGIAITAGTYATLGASAPARLGLSVLKAARKTGRITARMSEWIGRALREIVDWSALRRAIAGASLTDPAVAVRAAREAVKLDKTDALVRLVGDVGHVQTKAGTRRALEGLKLAEAPRDVSRVAQVAEKYGSKTRAVLKLGGRATIFLTASAFSLFSWVLAAAMTVLAFVASCKRAAERATERHLYRRKERRALERLRFAAMTMRGPGAFAAPRSVAAPVAEASAGQQEASVGA